MSSATPFDPDPLEDVVRLMEAAADRMDQARLWCSGGPKFADSVERYERAMRRLEFGRLRSVMEFDVQDVAGQQAGLTTEAFLVARLWLSPGEARARIRSAQELVGSVSISGELVEPELPATAAAASEGALSAEHVQVIGQAMKKLPPTVDPADRARAEEFLAEQSRDMDPRRVRVLARRLHAVLDPDGTLDEDKPDRRGLVFRRDVGGMDYTVVPQTSLDRSSQGLADNLPERHSTRHSATIGRSAAATAAQHHARPTRPPQRITMH